MTTSKEDAKTSQQGKLKFSDDDELLLGLEGAVSEVRLSDLADVDGQGRQGRLPLGAAGQKSDDKDARREQGRVQREVYNKLKEFVATREDKALTKIIAIRQRENWFRFVGHSALIFYYDIAPKIGYKARWYKDDDYQCHLDGGFVNIKSISMLTSLMVQHHYDIVKQTENYVVFNAKQEFSLADIEMLQKNVNKEWDAVNKMFLPKDSMPVLYQLIRDLYQSVYFETRKMSGCARETVGNDLVRSVGGLIRDYVVTCNGEGVYGSEYFERLEERLNVINGQLACIATVHEMNVRTMSRIGYKVAEIGRELTRCSGAITG